MIRLTYEEKKKIILLLHETDACGVRRCSSLVLLLVFRSVLPGIIIQPIGGYIYTRSINSFVSARISLKTNASATSKLSVFTRKLLVDGRRKKKKKLRNNIMGR